LRPEDTAMTADTPSTLRRFWPFGIMLILGTIWGGTPSISKFIATHGVPPLGSVFWQSGLAAIVLLTIAYARGGRVPLTWRTIGYFFAVGFAGYALPNANMILVTGHIPAGLMAVVLTLNPVFTYLWILALRIERPNVRRAGGIALGLAGALVLVLPRGTLPDPAALPYLLGAFVTPVLYSFGNAWAEKHRPAGMDSFALAGAMVGAASVGMGIAALATGTFHPIWQAASAANFVIAFYAALSVAIFYHVRPASQPPEGRLRRFADADERRPVARPRQGGRAFAVAAGQRLRRRRTPRHDGRGELSGRQRAA